MSTRSSITVRSKDNERLSAYCHHDGYLEGVGETLLKNYNSKEKALELVKLGDMSSLGEQIASKEGQQHSFDNADEGVTVYYGRDRGETGTEPRVLKETEEIDSQQFNYYHDGIRWTVGGKDLKSLLEKYTNKQEV